MILKTKMIFFIIISVGLLVAEIGRIIGVIGLLSLFILIMAIGFSILARCDLSEPF